MKQDIESRDFRANGVLSKVGCPVCAELKEFQNFLLKNLRPYECTRVCNLHAWVIANSSPAESVATMFLAWLRNSKWRPAHPTPSECNICKRMKLEKEMRLTEFCDELGMMQPNAWLEKHGMLCLRHCRELIDKLPGACRKPVEQGMSQKVVELEQELADFLERVIHGEHAGGGILGRAAEYLVANRGIES
jgi:hypothetical protein